MPNPKQLTELNSGSLRFTTRHSMIYIDDAPEETEQCSLDIEGTPDGYRWLAQQLLYMADHVEQSSSGYHVAVRPSDFANTPIGLQGWDAIVLNCGSKAQESP
jgi:hypothetical protein